MQFVPTARYNPTAGALTKGLSLGVSYPAAQTTQHLGVPTTTASTTPIFSMNTQSSQQPKPSSVGPIKSFATDGKGGSTYTFHPPEQPQQAAPNQPSPAPAPAQNTQNNTTSFPGLVSSLANNSLKGSPMAGAAGQGLVNTAQTGGQPAQTYAAQAAGYGAGSIPIVAQARDIAQQFGQRYADTGQKGAAFQAGQLTTGTTPVAEGNAAVTAQTTAAQQQALAQGEQAALAGLQPQLQGQQQAAQAAESAAGTNVATEQQAISALNSAGGLGIQGQGQLQSGLTSAAGLSQPQAYGLTTQPYFPTTDTYGGGGSSGALGRAALAGQIAATQSNVATAGTAATDAANSGYSQAVQTYNNMYTLNQSATQQAQTVQGILQQTGLNAGIPDWNQAINSLSGKLGSTAVTQLTTAITELQNRYSQLLNSRGITPTGSEQQALNLLSPNSSAAQIMASIQQLNTAAFNSLQPAYQQIQTYQSQLQGGGATPSGATGGGLYSW